MWMTRSRWESKLMQIFTFISQHWSVFAHLERRNCKNRYSDSEFLSKFVYFSGLWINIHSFIVLGCSESNFVFFPIKDLIIFSQPTSNLSCKKKKRNFFPNNLILTENYPRLASYFKKEHTTSLNSKNIIQIYSKNIQISKHRGFNLILQRRRLLQYSERRNSLEMSKVYSFKQ